MTYLVTVLIPFYNPGKFILDAIGSIYAQSYSNLKMILVDDASTDNSLELIQPYLADPRITLLRHSFNQGMSKSLNTGLQVIDTPYFVQLDPDDWFYPNTLEKLMDAALVSGRDVALLSGNINVSFENESGQVLRSIIRKGRNYSNPYDFLLANSSVWPRCYRTSTIKELGGWPVDDIYEGRYVEDMRMLLKIIPHYRFTWMDELMLYHRRHDSNNTNNLTETATVLRYTIEETLKNWGDIYSPIFKYEGEYMILDHLVVNNSN